MAKIEGVYSLWGFGDEADGDAGTLTGGLHEDYEITEANAKYLAAGEAAGTVVIVEATDEERKLLDGHVQSQEDGEKAYDEAVESGDWREGHLVQFAHDTELRLSDPTIELTDGEREWLSNGLADAYDEIGEKGDADKVRAQVKEAVAARRAAEAEIEAKDASGHDTVGEEA